MTLGLVGWVGCAHADPQPVPSRNDGHCLEVDRYRLPGRRHRHVSYWLDGDEISAERYQGLLLGYAPTREVAESLERDENLGMAGFLSGGVALVSSLAGLILCREQACLVPATAGVGAGFLLTLVSGLFGMHTPERSEAQTTDLFNEGSGGCRRLRRD